MKEVWKKVKEIGWILGLFIVSQLGSVGLVVGRALGFSIPVLFSILAFIFGIICLFLFVAKREKIATFDFRFFDGKSLLSLGLAYLAVVVIQVNGSLILSLDGADTTANQEVIQLLFKDTPKLVMFTLVVLLAPITEEIIFRGYIPKLLFKGKEVWGYIVGVLLFALAHGITNLGSLVIYGGMGSVLAYLAYRSKRVELAILFHILNNFIAFLLLLIGGA